MAGIIHKELSDRGIGAALKVHRIIGPGLVESAYEASMAIEFKHLGILCSRQEVYPLYTRKNCFAVSAV